jgi:hypothetical protein
MKRIITIAALSFVQSAFAADEHTPLVKSPEPDFELVIIEDAITIQKAYDQNLRANTQGCLVFVNQNLSACAGLSALKDKLHLDTITYLNFSGNKLQEVPTEIFTTMPNLAKCDLSGNAITKMCHPIPPHQKLKMLLLYNNQLTHIPLEQLLQNVPLTQLILDENKIKDYGLLRTDHPSLEELWIDKGTQKWVKQMIASRCPNLVAEMCEGDTTVQDVNTKVEYSEKCNAQCCSASGMGAKVGGICLCVTGSLSTFGCLFASLAGSNCYNVLHYSPLSFIGSFALMVFGGAGTGALIGAGAGALCAVYCCTKPEEHITKTILKKIAQYPPIIETLRKQAQNKFKRLNSEEII